MRLNLKALFVPQLAYAPGILADAANVAKTLRRHNLADIGDQKLPDFVSRTHNYLSMKRKSRLSSPAESLVWHCHTTRIRHPSAFSFRLKRASRLMLPSIFRFQNGLLVCGIPALEHPLCPCQKQPCTKISFPRPTSRMSGLPRIDSTLPRKRQPSRLRQFLTSLSGDVFRPLMLAIMRLRFCFVNRSVMGILSGCQHGENGDGDSRRQGRRYCVADLPGNLDFRSGELERVRE